jgi:hypothetical protein
MRHGACVHCECGSPERKYSNIMMKVKNQLDATKYAVLLPQHVSGTNMPIISSAINK